MPSLADLQAAVHRALTSGDGAPLESILVGGRRPLDRFSIHQRHYRASLVTALIEKFPATGWLIGSDALIQVAQAFVSDHPPDRPCIAEYGASFPAFLAGHAAGAKRPYLRPFAALEWYVSQVSIATSEPPIPWTEIVVAGAHALSGSVLGLQSGIRYMKADELPRPPDVREFPSFAWKDTFEVVDDGVWVEKHEIVEGYRFESGWCSRLETRARPLSHECEYDSPTRIRRALDVPIPSTAATLLIIVVCRAYMTHFLSTVSSWPGVDNQPSPDGTVDGKARNRPGPEPRIRRPLSLFHAGLPSEPPGHPSPSQLPPFVPRSRPSTSSSPSSSRDELRGP